MLVWSSRALRVVSQQLGAQQHRVGVQVVVLAALLRRVPLLGRRVWQQSKAILQIDTPPARDEAVAVDAWAPNCALAAVRGQPGRSGAVDEEASEEEPPPVDIDGRRCDIGLWRQGGRTAWQGSLSAKAERSRSPRPEKNDGPQV
eukprot:scaffold13879_cov61-Phaeocystis_antarctica.AAC.2